MSSSKKPGKTTRDVGRSEPGFKDFAQFRRRAGTTDATLDQYAEFIGTVRNICEKPLLSLDVDGVEALDDKLLKKAPCYRAVLKMFYRVHKRMDLLDALPRQRREKERRIGLDDVLMPDDVMALINAAGSIRDCAILAVLAATGGRINEVLGLKLKDLKQSNGGYVAWFGTTKVKSQERFSPKIEGVWKETLDAWLKAHPSANDRDAWLFPSSTDLVKPVGDGTVGILLRGLKEKAHLKKDTNPHAFRHARVTWGIINEENTAKLSIGIWGKPSSNQINRYVHFAGLDTKIVAPEEIELPDVPALPVPPIISTQAHVSDLQTKLERLEGFARSIEEWEPDTATCKKCGVKIVRWTPFRKYCDKCAFAMRAPLVDRGDVRRGLAVSLKK
jgi:integrase